MPTSSISGSGSEASAGGLLPACAPGPGRGVRAGALGSDGSAVGGRPGPAHCAPRSAPSKTQQYDCKWYIPLTDLSFQTLDESEAAPAIPLVVDEELDAMKIKISQIKSDIQREKVGGEGRPWPRAPEPAAAGHGAGLGRAARGTPGV